MPHSALESAVCSIDWSGLTSTYASGEIVREIVLDLASRDQEAAKRAWGNVNETALQHQGTVYPATAAAAPFLCQIALDDAALWRAALTAEIAFLSVGNDEPYSPAGTATAVRDAIRPYVGELLKLWGTADAGLDMALVAVSAAFPVESEVVTAGLQNWFDRASKPLRTALGLALGFHGAADEGAAQIVVEEVGQSITWVTRSGGLIAFVPNESPFPRPSEEPYFASSVPEAIGVSERLRAGAEEQPGDFTPVFSFLLTLMEYGGYVIQSPS